jgi:hypothetical protein
MQLRLAGAVVCGLVAVHGSARGDDAGATRDEPAAPDPAPRGPLVQLRSAAFAPLGGAVPLPMGSLDRVVRSERVPIRLDLGYRLPHVYAGVFGQKSHGTIESARLTSGEPAPSPGSVSSFELGATAEYHFLPRALLDPWAGVYGARRSIWIANDGATGVRFRGPELGLCAGVDARVARPLTVGVFVTAGYSVLNVSFADDSHPLDSHAKTTWLGAGLRVSAFL